jgi:hypothetical protein
LIRIFVLSFNTTIRTEGAEGFRSLFRAGIKARILKKDSFKIKSGTCDRCIYVIKYYLDIYSSEKERLYEKTVTVNYMLDLVGGCADGLSFGDASGYGG